MPQSKNPQSLIAQMMLEEFGMGPTSSGTTPSQGSMSLPFDGDPSVSVLQIQSDDESECDEQEGYTSKELKIAKKFIELMGSADRAREILDKVDDCLECLDIVDEQPADDASAIEKMAGLMPMLPDLPMAAKAAMDLSTLYNPNAVSGAM